MLCTCTSHAQSKTDDKHVRYIYDKVAFCVAAAINGIWSNNGIPVLYDLTFLLCLKIIRAEGRGEKEVENRMEKKQRKNNGEKKRGKKTNKRKRDRMKKQGKGRKGKGKKPPKNKNIIR